MTVAEIAAQVRSGELAPLDLVELVLERCRTLDGALNAFVLVDGEAAREEADRRTEDVRRGRPLGPLHGVPFAVKDLIDLRGSPTQAQSRALRSAPARRDAAVVARLRQAGAVPVGKLTLEEFGIGVDEDDTPMPPARNPWALERTAGGSSTGAGAAVAAGLVPLAIGTDTGGSIRLPAAFCGVVGLKPSYGAISMSGVLPLAPSLDHVGWITPTVEDGGLVLDALRGPGGGARAGTLEGLRVGVIRHFYERDVPASPELRTALEDALAAIAAVGAELVELETETAEVYERCGSAILAAEGYALHRHRLTVAGARYGRGARAALLAGVAIGRAGYVEARRQRRLLVRRMAETLERVGADLLATAVTPGPAWRIGDAEGRCRTGDRSLRMAFNVLGYPALALPIGFTSDGLPLSLQLAARPGHERALIRAGAAYQRVTDWHRRTPPTRGEAAPRPQDR